MYEYKFECEFKYTYFEGGKPFVPLSVEVLLGI